MKDMIQNERLIEIYGNMLKIRRFEEKVGELVKGNEVSGLVHLSIGMEATHVGACAALKKDDYITGTHRSHGHVIAKGGDINRMMAELYGKSTGYNKGKGGSMHMTDFSLGILGENGIVGAGIPIATGAGTAIKLEKTDQVVLCFFGDGASNRGTFHEGINLASIWKLPVVFLCENNMYGMSVPIAYSANIKNLSDRAGGYGIPGITVDGNEIMVVYEAVQEAVKRARSGGGPSLIECKTYRLCGDFEGDFRDYRPKEELEAWKKRDPIYGFRKRLIETGVLTEAESESIDNEIKKEIEDAVKFAMESPEPRPEEALEDVYA